MSDEIEDVEEIEDVDGVEEGSPQESEAEVSARERGWVPEDEWEGPDGKWMPAEDFNEMNSRRLQQADGIAKAEISRLNGELSELKTTINDLGAYMKKADSRAMEKARAALETEMREAVADGDVEAYDRISDDIKDLADDAEEKVEEAKPDPEGDPAFKEWHGSNDWYNEDVDMTVFADNAASIVARNNPGVTGAPFYEKVDKLVKAKFPDKFENTRRNKAPKLEGANNGTGKGQGGLWAQVDKEGRDAFSRFVTQGVFDDTKEDRNQYADDYING